MKITKQNYFSEVKRIGFENLPEALKKSHLVIMTKADEGKDWERCEKDEELMKVIGLSFEKLEEFIKHNKKDLSGVQERNMLLDNVTRDEVPVIELSSSKYRNISKEVYFITRFLEFHDKVLYKKTFEIFLNELQESIKRKEITKRSPVAKEVMAMQDAALKAYNSMKHAKHFVLLPGTIRKFKMIIEKHENAIDSNYDTARKKKEPLQGIPIQEEKLMCSTDFLNMQFQSIGFQGKWKELIGDPAKGFTSMVFGMPKVGKSYLCIDFAGYLARNHGKVLYVAKEEKLDATLQKKLSDKEVAHPNLFVSDFLPDDLSVYDFIFLDSVNKLGLTPKDLDRLKASNPGKSFIFIFQTTKQGIFRGRNEFQHDVDVVIEVPERGKAVQFGRFNQGGEIQIFEEQNEDNEYEHRKENKE